MVRSLTDAEGRVIAVLLGAATANERERLRRVGTPRSTYHAARRRAYAEGWLRDRYVPDPGYFDYAVVTFAVLRPFADRVDDLADRWSRDTANVLSWTSAQVALGVFFHRDQAAATTFADQVTDAKLASAVTLLAADANGPTIPVYFDYEGLWTHMTHLEGNLAYPTGLGGRRADGPEGPTKLTPHQRWAATELVRRPFEGEEHGRAGHLVGPFGLPFSQQNALRRGWVTHRVFVEPSVVPPFQGRSADQLVLITGSLRTSARPERLFAALTRECRVFPFLFVASHGRLLLGALGRGTAGGATADTTERRPVMATLQESLEGIEVVQEPVASFRTVVDHRYDRLLLAKGRA